MSHPIDPEAHNRRITEQFTRQAAPFAELHTVDDSVRLMMAAAQVGPADRVLDVACGPGLLACAFAGAAAHVTGVDLTPAMLDQARRLQAARGLTNVDWHVADVTALPFPDGRFSVVVSRYAMHHFLEPATVAAEMVRACAPGGRVVVADVYSTSAAQGALYDAMERLRDPSHVRAVGREELVGLLPALGLRGVEAQEFRFGVDVDRLLQATGTPPDAAEQVRRIVSDDVGHDRLGIGAHRSAGAVGFSFPVVIVSGRKPA
jgi:ubiquinone/menaquinone biosynthesis C-methylase UbiE